MSIVTYPHKYGNDDIAWLETPTAFYSTASQCTPLWDALHIGSMSASRASTFLGMSKFSESKEECALQCVGLSKKSFNSEQLDRTQIGILGEPLLRTWYSNIIRIPIQEVGIAVWKKDSRFRASLDGIYGQTRSVEFKVTDTLYWPLIEHFNALKKGLKTPPSKYEHIWNTHYNQMIQSMIITGRKSMDYIVAGYKKNLVYIEEIPANDEYWLQEIYPKAVEFLNSYVEPLMRQRNIQRIDPWMLESAVRL